MRGRIVVVGIIFACWAVIALLLSDFSPLRVVRITPTPTRTPKATFTATAIPTQTLTPSPTPVPPDTPTASPVPSSTPLPTATPTTAPTVTDTATPLPSQTATASSTSTASPAPTARPTSPPVDTPLPKPTNTPAPPFKGQIVQGFTHCGGYAGVTGFVKHPDGAGFPGIAVGVWSDAWQGNVSVSEASGKYDVDLSGLPAGTYRAAVVRIETCSQQEGRFTAINCQQLSNVVDNLRTTEHCEGDGANQVTKVDFVGP